MCAYDARMSRISVVGVPSSAGSYAAGQDQAPRGGAVTTLTVQPPSGDGQSRRANR